MDTRVLIIQNIGHEGPGIFQEVMLEHKIEHHILDLSNLEDLPPAGEFSHVVVLGGPQSANDTEGHIPREIEFIRSIVDKEIPYLGVCLGMQLLVKATGGEVVPCHTKEIGWWGKGQKLFSMHHAHTFLDDPLLNKINNNIPVFQLHGETVELTARHKLLAKSEQCRNQLIKYGRNAYGIQGHLELNETMLNTWLKTDPDLKKADKDEILITYEAIRPEYDMAGKRMFWNFLNRVSG